jgi:hypothetical protein
MTALIDIPLLIKRMVVSGQSFFIFLDRAQVTGDGKRENPVKLTTNYEKTRRISRTTELCDSG